MRLRVTPKDNGDGTINAEYQIVKSGTTVDGEIVPVEKAVFHNVYNAYWKADFDGYQASDRKNH